MHSVNSFTLLEPALLAGRDRRKAIRYPCGAEITCRFINGEAEDFWALRVQNISEAGIKLIMDHVLPTGSMVAVELHNQSRKYACRREIAVLFSFEDLRGGVVLGATFVHELSSEELVGLRGSVH